MSLVNLFPLRFAKGARLLRDRYRSRLDLDITGRIRLEIHTQDDCAGLPDLFLPDAAEIMKAARPLLLLGEITGSVRDEENVVSGRSQLVFSQTADDGIAPPPEVLGRSHIDALTEISERRLEALRREVGRTLAALPTGHVDFQQRATETLNSRLRAILAALNSDATGRPYAEWNEAARLALQIIKGEAVLGKNL